ncbi:MAG: hypothetical protein GY804_00265 [Alphaproteobacteria bacterium]|nr:hypothetical protein [Alphaproteobacteria bacterium]
MAKSPKTGKEIPVHIKGKVRQTLSLEKKSSNDVGVSRLALGAKGYDGLRTVHGRVVEHLHPELRWPLSIITYRAMELDPTIAAINNFYDMMISRADFKFVAPVQEDGTVKAEVQAATDFLNYCMINMEDQTWQQFISGVGTYRIYGFSIAEKVWTTVKRGKYKGRLKWKALAQRSQETVKEWRWDKNNPDLLTGVIQRSEAMDATRYKQADFKGEREIDRSKFILFRFDPKKNNPQGTSPLDGAWKAWKYLNLVQEYQAVGIAKDLGGIPVLGIPVDKLIEAAADPSGVAAQTQTSLKEMAASLHAGDRTFAIKPILYDDQGKELYTFELQGITGSGKQYDTTEVIRQYQNEILTVYSASMLKLGQDASGSFALSDNMNNMLGFAVQHNLDILRDQINIDLVPQTLAINGWLFEEEDMPRLEYGDVAPRDLDELGKYVQRVVTSGGMTIGKNLDQALREAADLPLATYEDDDEVPDEFLTGKQSNAGEGDGTSGTGGSQTNGDNNTENT